MSIQEPTDPGRRGRPLTIVVPVFNEADNFPQLWEGMSSLIRSEFVAIVVYDFDEDNTIPVVQQLIRNGEARVRLVKNEYGDGVVGALRTGFKAIAHGPVLVIMADLSDDLKDVDAMTALYREGYDVVVGSRYMPGGRIVGGPWLKKTMSRLAGTSLHYLRGMPTHDATNAFKMYDVAMLNSLTIESREGFELNLEITVKAFLRDRRIAEIPTVWIDRTAGTSRFRLWKWLPSYLRWYLYAFRPRRRSSTA
jgi:glycosyltransferase involved in cell wall biosynthesis